MLIIKDLMRLLKDDQMISAQIIQYLANSTEMLANHHFGNYVIQKAIELYDLKAIQSIVGVIIEKIGEFSFQKFASNVVEKCIKASDELVKSKFALKVASLEKLGLLMENLYGNYVLETLIESQLSEEDLETLIL